MNLHCVCGEHAASLEDGVSNITAPSRAEGTRAFTTYAEHSNNNMSAVRCCMGQ
jgi:hypothetical protein